MYPFDLPDKIILPSTAGASKVSGRIGLDIAPAMESLAFLVNSGPKKQLSLPLFNPMHDSLLYKIGQEKVHECVINIEDKDRVGRSLKGLNALLYSEGQAHLIASAAVIQLQPKLSMGGFSATAVGIHYPEKAVNIDAALELQIENGGLIEGLSLSSQLCFANRGGLV